MDSRENLDLPSRPYVSRGQQIVSAVSTRTRRLESMFPCAVMTGLFRNGESRQIAIIIAIRSC